MSDAAQRIRILCVDDHPIVRQGIAGLIAVQPDMTLVAEASNGREAIQQFRAHRPDVTLMDLQMPEMGGLAAEVSFELAERATDDALTPAETRVLWLIAQGNANEEIAGAFELSEEIVKGQVRNILSKLGAKDCTHAAMIGFKRGTIEL